MEKHIKGTRAFTAAMLAVSFFCSAYGIVLIRKAAWQEAHFDLPTSVVFPIYVAAGYGCAAALIVMLIILWKFLGRIEHESVFSEATVRDLERIGRCCLAGALLSGVFGVFFRWSFLAAAAAAVFMYLILRVVRDAFGKALEMKDELDLTI
ncbi:MAG: DUF2975 domain-containing protein [Eubacterium sp.]|jgi:hypothetical protein